MRDLQESHVVIVGAGLAVLRCASVLEHAGLSVTVLEASDAVCGQMRTDVIDGFRCDRGFQVLNPSCPQVKSGIDSDALDLNRFDAGLRVRTSYGVETIADPVRAPHLVWSGRLVGYSTSSRMKARLAVQALEQAVDTRARAADPVVG